MAGATNARRRVAPEGCFGTLMPKHRLRDIQATAPGFQPEARNLAGGYPIDKREFRVMQGVYPKGICNRDQPGCVSRSYSASFCGRGHRHLGLFRLAGQRQRPIGTIRVEVVGSIRTLVKRIRSYGDNRIEYDECAARGPHAVVRSSEELPTSLSPPGDAQLVHLPVRLRVLSIHGSFAWV